VVHRDGLGVGVGVGSDAVGVGVAVGAGTCGADVSGAWVVGRARGRDALGSTVGVTSGAEFVAIIGPTVGIGVTLGTTAGRAPPAGASSGSIPPTTAT
jgi:hypothetical protein